MFNYFFSDYEVISVEVIHPASKRSGVETDQPSLLNFNAMGQSYSLQLHKNRSIIHHQLILEFFLIFMISHNFLKSTFFIGNFFFSFDRPKTFPGSGSSKLPQKNWTVLPEMCNCKYVVQIQTHSTRLNNIIYSLVITKKLIR